MRLSYSAYSTYKTCPLRFKLEREYPLRGPEFADLLIGKYMHSYFYDSLGIFAERKEPQEIWDEIKQGKTLLDAREMPEEFEDLKEMMDYYRSLSHTLVLSFPEEWYVGKIERILNVIHKVSPEFQNGNYQKEVVLADRCCGVELFGIVDMLGDHEIVEIKTGRLSENYNMQIKFYSLLFYLKRYVAPRATLLSLYDGESKNFKFSVKELEKLRMDAINATKRMKGGIFTPRIGEHCKYCPYHFFCEKRV